MPRPAAAPAVEERLRAYRERRARAREERKEEEEEEEEEEDAYEVRVAWSSGADGAGRTGPGPGGGGDGTDDADDAPPALDEFPVALGLNAEGNAHVKQRRYADAVACYTGAIDAIAGAPDRRCAIPLSNRSHARLMLAASAGGEGGDAERRRSVRDAELLCRLCPRWSKSFSRLATALLRGGEFARAASTLRQGMAASGSAFRARRDFERLYDEVAMAGAAAGSLAAFNGDLLEVRSAGEEAWLGLPAPRDPELDADDEDGAVEGRAIAGAAAAGAGAELGRVLVRPHRRRSFRSLRDAVAHARDNDRIVLLRGTHNVGGDAVVIDKRLLIFGQGRMGEAVVDQRANAPAFTVARPSVIGGLRIELTGFRECIRFDAPAAAGADKFPSAIVEGCAISSSGADGVHVVCSAPLIRRCSIVGRHCALIASGPARGDAGRRAPVRVHDCTLGFSPAGGGDGGQKSESCEQQCVRAMRGAHVAIEGCEIARAKMEGVVCMDAARVSLRNASVFGNGGPGIDVSGDGEVAVSRTSIRDNCGGVWVWDSGRVAVDDAAGGEIGRGAAGAPGIGNWSGTTVSGGSSHALLVCDGGAVDFAQPAGGRVPVVVGVVDVYDDGRVSGVRKGGAVVAASVDVGEFERTSLPPEKGPAFRFVPNEFTRKQ